MFTTHESQISLCFALRLLVFQIIEVFDFSISYNGEFEIFNKKKIVKNRNSKFQNSQTYFCEDHPEENSGKVSKLLAVICRRNRVLKFSLPLDPMLTKTKKKKIVKISIFKISKIPNFVRTITKKIQENSRLRFNCSSRVLKFSLPYRALC